MPWANDWLKIGFIVSDGFPKLQLNKEIIFCNLGKFAFEHWWRTKENHLENSEMENWKFIYLLKLFLQLYNNAKLAEENCEKIGTSKVWDIIFVSWIRHIEIVIRSSIVHTIYWTNKVVFRRIF